MRDGHYRVTLPLVTYIQLDWDRANMLHHDALACYDACPSIPMAGTIADIYRRTRWWIAWPGCDGIVPLDQPAIFFTAFDLGDGGAPA